MTTKTTTHTPGPWMVEEYSGGSVEVWPSMESNRLTRIATLERQIHDEHFANAKLIAAAPDMLELLRRFVAGWERRGNGTTLGDIHDARDLLQRLEGNNG